MGCPYVISTRPLDLVCYVRQCIPGCMLHVRRGLPCWGVGPARAGDRPNRRAHPDCAADIFTELLLSTMWQGLRFAVW